ncbi:MAG: Holliday junction branch migration protein RuvA [Eggerthellaceae bacterium]
MIAFLKGVLAGKTADTAYVEVGGVGYSVGMASGALARLPETGQPVLVYTHLQVREDALALFGFLSLQEKAVFERLTSVSGVGPKAALGALSVFSPEELVAAITAQDVAAISRIPGVGKKIAARIILELKGALDAGIPGQTSAFATAAAANFQGARDALLSMGFTTAEADLALKDAPGSATEAILLQYALKRLGD